MPVTGHELRSRRFTLDNVQREYYVHGPATEKEVFDWINDTLPATLLGLPISTFDAEEVEESEEGDWRVDVTWGRSDDSQSPEEVGSAEYRFNFVAPGEQIYQSLFNVSAHSVSGTPRDFKGCINVVNDDGKDRVEGINLSPPSEVFTYSYTFEGGISSSYQLLVEALVGKVNSSSFGGRAAGSIMLVRASGGRTSQNQSNVEFGFGAIQNATNIPVGNITVTSKDGFDLLWAYYGPAEDTDAKALVKQPQYAYVERVYERANLNSLGLPI